MTKIRLLLLEDNRLLREGLTAMLNEQPDIEVVAAFGNGKEAVLKATRELKPQIILLDLGLKDQNSLRLVESVKQEFSEIKVIVMDLLPVQADVVEFVKEGLRRNSGRGPNHAAFPSWPCSDDNTAWQETVAGRRRHC